MKSLLLAALLLFCALTPARADDSPEISNLKQMNAAQDQEISGLRWQISDLEIRLNHLESQRRRE